MKSSTVCSCLHTAQTECLQMNTHTKNQTNRHQATQLSFALYVMDNREYYQGAQGRQREVRIPPQIGKNFGVIPYLVVQLWQLGWKEYPMPRSSSDNSRSASTDTQQGQGVSTYQRVQQMTCNLFSFGNTTYQKRQTYKNSIMSALKEKFLWLHSFMSTRNFKSEQIAAVTFWQEHCLGV